MAEEDSSDAKRRRVEEIVNQMQVRLQEIERLHKELKREELGSITPQQTRAMMEEIIVPPLEMIIDERKRKAAH